MGQERLNQRRAFAALSGFILLVSLAVLGATRSSAAEEATPTPVSYLPVVSKLPPPLIAKKPGAPNLLPNPSFEDGWYHPGGVAELQVPNQWVLEWDEGFNPVDPDPWNEFVRPESRLLNKDFLPPSEHDLFIWDGEYTVKIFKGYGALSYRLLTDVHLKPGSYLFEIHVFPDLIVGYTSKGKKIWAPDPLSGEVRFIVDGPVGGADGSWTLPEIGQKNTLQHVFTVTHERDVKLGVAFRGRWAIENNGWFMDDWSLTSR